MRDAADLAGRMIARLASFPLVESARGAVPGVAISPFPQAALRTRRACFHAAGSPRHLGGSATVQGGAAVAVPRDGYRGQVEQFDPVRRRSGPPAMQTGEMSADVSSIPAVQYPEPANHSVSQDVPGSSWCVWLPMPGVDQPRMIWLSRISTALGGCCDNLLVRATNPVLQGPDRPAGD